MQYTLPYICLQLIYCINWSHPKFQKIYANYLAFALLKPQLSGPSWGKNITRDNLDAVASQVALLCQQSPKQFWIHQARMQWTECCNHGLTGGASQCWCLQSQSQVKTVGSPENSETPGRAPQGLIEILEVKKYWYPGDKFMFYSSSGGEMHFAQVFWEKLGLNPCWNTSRWGISQGLLGSSQQTKLLMLPCFWVV